MKPDVALSIEAEHWSHVPDVENLVDRAVAAAAQIATARLHPGAEVSVMLCDDRTIRELNRDWRDKDSATNVLSFPAAGPVAVEQRPLLGDIAVAWETTAREAAEEGKDVSAHLSHLIVHGFLHLIGYDHGTAAEAEAMEGAEVQALAILGVSDPYAGSDLLEKHAQ